jgi:hypothetical protein
LSVDFTQVTPTHYLLDVAPLWEAHFSVQAGLPTAREAKLLRLKTSDPASSSPVAPAIVAYRSRRRGWCIRRGTIRSKAFSSHELAGRAR